MNVWSNSQPVSRYVNHTSPTRRLAHFPQLSHELSPATGPFKRPQPATISLPRCDCNLGHIWELCATLLQPLPVDPRFTPQRLADPFRSSLIPPSPPCPHCPSHPGRTLRSTPRTSPASDANGGSSRRPGPLPKASPGSELPTPRDTFRNSRTAPVPEPPKSGVASLKPLPRCQNKALGVDSTPLPDASARVLVAVRLWRRQRIWQWIRQWNLPHAERGGTRPSRPRRQG